MDPVTATICLWIFVAMCAATVVWWAIGEAVQKHQEAKRIREYDIQDNWQ